MKNSSLRNLILALIFITILIALRLHPAFNESKSLRHTPLLPLDSETPTAELTNSLKQASHSAQPNLTPTPPLTPSQEAKAKQKVIEGGENYQLVPCKSADEGCYNIFNAPPEAMTTADELNSAVNQYRTTHNLNPLYIDPQLCQIAQERAQEASQDFSHAGFEQHLTNGDFDYTGYSAIAENLWQGSFSAVHIVEFGWDKSPGHKANLQGDWSRGCAGVHSEYAVFIFVR